MNDKNFKNTSFYLRELENFIAADTAAISARLEAAFHYDAEAAVYRISEVNQIASARISTAAQIAAAKTVSDAEVASATLSALTYTRLKAICEFAINDEAGAGQISESLKKLVDNGSVEIRKYSRSVIEKLEMDAAEAISQIKINSENALNDLSTLIENIEKEIDSNKKKAKERLYNSNKLGRTEEKIQNDADEAATLVYKQFGKFSERINFLCRNAIAEIESATNTAVNVISASVAKANERIVGIQNKCLNSMRIILSRIL